VTSNSKCRPDDELFGFIARILCKSDNIDETGIGTILYQIYQEYFEEDE